MAKNGTDRNREPEWPSVEEQLAAARIAHGTALEQLVRENQDFSLLDSEEAHDRLRLPPWLRVYWRKQHPESAPAAGDPTRGYPLALHDIYLWMIGHQDLRPERGAGPEQGGDHAR
jgi:hypothetical protein